MRRQTMAWKIHSYHVELWRIEYTRVRALQWICMTILTVREKGDECVKRSSIVQPTCVCVCAQYMAELEIRK